MSKASDIIIDDNRFTKIFDKIAHGPDSRNGYIVAAVIADLADSWDQGEPVALPDRVADVKEIIAALQGLQNNNALLANPVSKQWQITYSDGEVDAGPYYSMDDAILAAYAHVAAGDLFNGFTKSFNVSQL